MVRMNKQITTYSSQYMQGILIEYLFHNRTGQIVVTWSDRPSPTMGFQYTIRFIHLDVA